MKNLNGVNKKKSNMLILTNSSGFSLIEIILALVVMAVMATAVLPLFGDTILSIISSGDRDEAITVASNVMENLYNQKLKYGDFNLEDYTVNMNGRKMKVKHKEKCTEDTTKEKNQINYCIDEVEYGIKLKVIVYYDNGKENVRLDSLVRSNQND